MLDSDAFLALWLTVQLSTVVTLILLVIGTPIAWWCRSADLGYAPGLWQCYQVSQNRLSDARRLLSAAADSGHEQASALLAQFYASGKLGFSKDPDKQKQLLCRAVALGNRLAIAPLARLNRANTATARRSRARNNLEQNLTTPIKKQTGKNQNAWHKTPPAKHPTNQITPAATHKEAEIKVKLVH